MNELIRVVYQQGLSEVAYYSFHVLSYILIGVFYIWYGQKLGIKVWKMLLTVLVWFPLAYLWTCILCWIENGFRDFGSNNIVRLFIYVPLFGIPIAKLLKIEWSRACDFLTFAPLISQAVGHCGCLFVGCCQGYPNNWGLYHPTRFQILFPVQVFEIITATAIIVVLLIWAKKRDYVPDKRQYPIMMIMFGMTRFVWEFFRNNEKIWLGCSALAFHALFMAMVGGVTLLVMRKRDRVAEQNA